MILRWRQVMHIFTINCSDRLAIRMVDLIVTRSKVLFIVYIYHMQIAS